MKQKQQYSFISWFPISVGNQFMSMLNDQKLLFEDIIPKSALVRKVVVILIAGLIWQLKLNAQASFEELENNKIMYPSPTAAGLGKYGEYPVSLYNGLVNIGQDIVTVKSGHLTLNVSLSYHASGNKPSDIPGWVGLGFSLNAGGVITRIIKDLPDDLGGFYSANDRVKNIWNSYPNSEFIEEYLNGILDPRSDIYEFNFCGYSGEFVFDWDRNIHFKQKLPFNIEVLGSLGGFGGFRVTTDDGTIYTFDQAEHSQLSPTSIDAPVSSWYLTKIKNLSGDSIVLKYTTPLSKFRYKQYPITRKQVISGQVEGGVVEAGPIINQGSSMDEVIYLDEIDFNNGKLIFEKSTRIDPYYIPSGISSTYAAEKKLSGITLTDNSGSVIKKWDFDYFENSTERLKLKSLTVQAADQTDVQRYSFEYNPVKLPITGGPNPSDPYISNAVDYWGYYNGAINSDNRIPKMYVSEYNTWTGSADRTIKPYYVQAEILNKITYPTGGYTSFEYESNDYSAQGASFALDQNPMTNPVLDPYYMSYNRDGGGFETDPNTQSFTLTTVTHVNIQYSAGATGDQHAWVAETGTIYNEDIQLTAGTYTVAGLLNTNELTSSTSADITKATGIVTVYRSVPTEAKIGPGLRIMSITTNDGMISRTRTFEYKLGGAQSNTTSSGFLSVFPAFYAPLQRIALNMSGFYATSDPINDIGDGPPVGYRRVVEHFEDGSYIVHYYSSYDYYPDETMSFTNGFSDPELAHMSSNDFWRGLETNTNYYNSDGVLQKEILNNYDTLPGTLTDVQCIEVKPTVGIIECLGCEVNNVNATINSIYYVRSCFLYNSDRIEKIYDKNGQNPITTAVYKYYDNIKHLQPTRIVTDNSDGSLITTTTSFPDDFAPGTPFIDYMKANHLISFPIEQVMYKQNGGVNNIVSGNIITYKNTGAGLADSILKFETAGPLLQANFKFSNQSPGVLPSSSTPAQYSADTHYKPVRIYTQYDSRGNPLEFVARNGIKTAYLWGYGKEYPVAEVVGTDYATASGMITNPSVLDNPSDDAALRTELNKLRTIPGTFSTTYTFAPLTGVTSQTDQKGRTTYYDYDLFNRLMVVRDQDNNIVKKICYNYSGQPESCNIYASAAINANYYSQNCPSGQGPVVYFVTVPEGKFLSYVDQQTANQLAQQYAQNQANQYGSCQVLNVSVYGENNHGTNIDIQFHNAASGQNYYFTIYPHDAGTLGDVPPGTYDITLSPNSSTGWYGYSVGCGYWADGPGAMTFYGVSISSGCNSILIE